MDVLQGSVIVSDIGSEQIAGGNFFIAADTRA